jgi:hypothetical protein
MRSFCPSPILGITELPFRDGNALQWRRQTLTAESGAVRDSVYASVMNDAQRLFQDCPDPSMSDGRIRALVELAHSENLWVSRDDGNAHWLIDGPSESVPVAFGATYQQWRRALLQAAGA